MKHNKLVLLKSESGLDLSKALATSEKDIARVVKTFLKEDNINRIAKLTNVPPGKVIEILNTPIVLDKAIYARKVLATLRFWHLVPDMLFSMLENTELTVKERIQISQILANIVGANKRVIDLKTPTKDITPSYDEAILES